MPPVSSSRVRWSNFIAAGLIVVLLGALLIPAIFAAREEARRMACANNLKELSLAVRMYADRYGSFPLGTVGSRALPPPQRFSWYLPLWDYMSSVHMPPVDTNQAWNTRVNRAMEIAGATFSVIRCPSAPRTLQIQGIRATQYVGMAGLGKDAPSLAIGDAVIGIWGYDRQTAPATIRDGAANTMLLIETLKDLGPWFAGGPPTVRGVDPTTTPLFGPKGQFGGLHSTIPATMADASVRQLDQTISPTVFSALTTIVGGK